MINILLIFLDSILLINIFIIKGYYFWEVDRNCKYIFIKINIDLLKDD